MKETEIKKYTGKIELLVIEYSEGCGYNARVTSEVLNQNKEIEMYSYWVSKYPFNRSNMQQRINRMIKEFPQIVITQDMVYSENFAIYHGGEE